MVENITENEIPYPYPKFKFTWDPCEDDHTPQAGLTYNMFIKAVYDGDEDTLYLKAPLADESVAGNGFRLLPDFGNVYHCTEWVLHMYDHTFPEEQIVLIWGVQAIDNSFRGSDFAYSIDTISFDKVEPINESPVRLNFDVFPNPVAEVATITVDKDLEILEITVYNNSGRKSLGRVFENITAGTPLNINVSDLASGLYFMAFRSGNFESLEKVIIK